MNLKLSQLTFGVVRGLEIPLIGVSDSQPLFGARNATDGIVYHGRVGI